MRNFPDDYTTLHALPLTLQTLGMCKKNSIKSTSYLNIGYDNLRRFSNFDIDLTISIYSFPLVDLVFTIYKTAHHSENLKS